jgi:hypothetical protein
MEVMCRHREKYAAFQLMQPARRPVIANPQGEAIQCTRMDCFTLRVRNDGGDSLKAFSGVVFRGG